MIKHTFYFIIGLVTIFNSCKETPQKESKPNNVSIEKKVNKKEYKIPDGLKIDSQEEINIDDDETKEIIITAVDNNADYFYEFWFKNAKLIYKFKYPWGSINRKWLINLDDDPTKEIVRIKGYEDGVDYVIYDIVKDSQAPILYFNPALVDKRYPDQYMWAYPNDIESLIVIDKNKLQVSLNSNYSRDDSHTQPKNQKELPFLFFNGRTSQPEAKISGINKYQVLPLQSILKKIQINGFDHSVKISQIFSSWQNDQVEIHIDKDNMTYLFNGQCIYAFDVKIINDNEVELIWGATGMDCTSDMQFAKTFGLSKNLIPQKGKPFAKYSLKNNVINVTYYYKEWIDAYRNQIGEKPFFHEFYLKE